MIRAKVIIVTVLLVSYGALGARQPAVRTSVPLPVPAAELAASLGLDPEDRSHLLVSIVRLVFDAPDGQSAEDQRRKTILTAQMKTPVPEQPDRVPLPLDTSIWRETFLDRRSTDVDIARAILSDRTIALLYHGLAALDDDTLGWLGPDRETLVHLRRNAGVFASFGRSVRVRSGRVAVPGGPDAEPVWSAIVGAEPARPSSFVQRLIRGNGRLAWFYDTILHLDADRQRFVFGDGGSEAQRVERLRNLLDVFEASAPEWQTPDRPFVRPPLDPSLVLSLAAVKGDGTVVGPDDRRMWEAVFREAGHGVPPAEPAAEKAQDSTLPVEPAWLVRRIAMVPAPIGRRRLETFLLAQRVFPKPPRGEANLLSALRGAAIFPALAQTLERIGINSPSAYAAAARAAAALNAIRSPEWQRVAIADFQSVLAILDRSTRTGGLERQIARTLIASLAEIPISSDRGYGGAFSVWLREQLVPALAGLSDAGDPVEDTVLSACAGVKDAAPAEEIVEWEGRRYRVDPAEAELRRLRRMRERQRSMMHGTPRVQTTLDARLASAVGAPDEGRLPAEQALAETLTAIVYAVYLGEADGAAASAGDVSARHDFALPDSLAPARNAAWRVPHEEYGERGGWRVVGSLLGLDAALGRLAVRRLDLSDMPGQPTLSANERSSAMLTASFFGPLRDANGVRDEIAASIARGRARVNALRSDRAEADRVAQDAGLSEWRREALGWTLEHEREKTLSRLSLVDLFWLGSPRGAPSKTFDAWGAATLVLDGCLCLRMPNAEPWESRAGRPSTGYLSTYGTDVTLRVAELLAELKLPAALAPAVVAYAMQDVVDLARPAFFDDWPAFQRTARDLPRERLIDYIAALAADGALLPLDSADARR